MLLRIAHLFETDAKWSELAPEARREARSRVLRPLVDELFSWASQRDAVHKPLGSRLARAFGYLRRHEEALRRFLEDGRLVLTNNRSESALRDIAIGRKNWMFFGSDDHASAAANLFSLVASARLHDLDVEQYLAEIILVLPQWPLARHLELAPKYWRETRTRIVEASERNAATLRDGIGLLDVPAEPPRRAAE
jgi:hypothetical protein